MGEVFPYQGRLVGVLLLLSVVSIVVGLVVVAMQGTFRGLSAGFRGVEGVGEAASALAVMAKAGLPYTLLQLIGFGIFAVMLRSSGEGLLSTLSLAVLIFASAVSVLRATFEGSVTLWAAEEWAATGGIPEVYEPLHAWINSVFDISYLSLLVAMAGFGWGILRTELLAPWIGWLSIGWSALWIVGYVVGVGIPAIIIIYPVIYGLGLLLS